MSELEDAARNAAREAAAPARLPAGVVLLLLALAFAFFAGRSCGLGLAEDRVSPRLELAD